jgi:hypothetical protein
MQVDVLPAPPSRTKTCSEDYRGSPVRGVDEATSPKFQAPAARFAVLPHLAIRLVADCRRSGVQSRAPRISATYSRSSWHPVVKGTHPHMCSSRRDVHALERQLQRLEVVPAHRAAGAAPIAGAPGTH